MKGTMKWLFPLIVLALLAPWPIAYAHNFDPTSLDGQDAVQIKIAELSAAPTWTTFARAKGGVTTPGDLFYIDATEYTGDIVVNLYLTNAYELSKSYSYLTLEVGIYVEGNASEWEKASTPDTFITLENGKVSFTLAGYAKYKVTIDGGSFYSINTNVNGGSISPQFHLTVD